MLLLLLLGIAVLVLLLRRRCGSRLGVLLLVLLLGRRGASHLRILLVLLLILLGLLLILLGLLLLLLGLAIRMGIIWCLRLLCLLRVDLGGVFGVLLRLILLVEHGLGLLSVHLDLAVVGGAGLLVGLEVQADLVGEVGEGGDEKEPAKTETMSENVGGVLGQSSRGKVTHICSAERPAVAAMQERPNLVATATRFSRVRR